MLGDIDLIFGIWVYNDELQIKFTFRSGPIIFGRVMVLGFERGKGVRVQNWPHILLKNNAWHRIKTIY